MSQWHSKTSWSLRKTPLRILAGSLKGLPCIGMGFPPWTVSGWAGRNPEWTPGNAVSIHKLQWTGVFFPKTGCAFSCLFGSTQTHQSRNKSCKLPSESLSWSIVLFRTKDLHVEHRTANRGNVLFKNQPIFRYFKIIEQGWYLCSFLVICWKLILLRTQYTWLFCNFNNNFTVCLLDFKTPVADSCYCKCWGGQSQEFDPMY